MTTYKFGYPVCLTWFHSIITALGMLLMAGGGMFTVKKLPVSKSAPVAAAYVGFIVFNNLSIQYNTVGFYQVRMCGCVCLCCVCSCSGCCFVQPIL